MALDERNHHGLDEQQIQRCINGWAVLTQSTGLQVDLLVDAARHHLSRTFFRESDGKVHLGADVQPGDGVTPGARMSILACLAHELAHAQRFQLGFKRPTQKPDMLLDEAETSLHASFFQDLGRVDRETLVEHARDRITLWLSIKVLPTRSTP